MAPLERHDCAQHGPRVIAEARLILEALIGNERAGERVELHVVTQCDYYASLTRRSRDILSGRRGGNRQQTA